MRFQRVVTNPPSVASPETLDEALHSVLASPVIRMTEPGLGRWQMFEDLVQGQQFLGGDIHDALLASACLGMRATLVTTDRGFARFAGLDVYLVGQENPTVDRSCEKSCRFSVIHRSQ